MPLLIVRGWVRRIFTFTTIDASDARGVNGAGQIVGSGYLKDGETYTPLDFAAHGINDTEQIVGFFSDGTYIHGVIKDGNIITTFDVPGAFSQTHAMGINGVGDIVGWYDDSSGGTHGFLRQGNTYISFDVPGARNTYASGINNAGQIVGHFSGASGSHSFLKDGSTFMTVDVPGANFTEAYGINDAGQIVGTFQDISGEHGFLATPSLGGSVTGMSPTTGRVTCRNLTTKKTVRITMPVGGRSWNCEQAGLVVNPGDEIQQTMTVIGPAD